MTETTTTSTPANQRAARSATMLMLSRIEDTMELSPLCEIGDQLTAAEWAVAADAEAPQGPYCVTVEQVPETNRAIIRSVPHDPVTAEVTAGDLAEALTRFGHQVESLRAGWTGAEVTIIVR